MNNSNSNEECVTITMWLSKEILRFSLNLERNIYYITSHSFLSWTMPFLLQLRNRLELFVFSVKGSSTINGRENINTEFIYYFNEQKNEMDLALCLKVVQTSIDGVMAYLFSTAAITDSPWLIYDEVGMCFFLYHIDINFSQFKLVENSAWILHLFFCFFCVLLEIVDIGNVQSLIFPRNREKNSALNFKV